MEDALLIVNTMHEQLATLARAVVVALQDNKVSVWEGIALSTKALGIAASLQAIVQGVDKEALADVLYVLEHARLTLPEA